MTTYRSITHRENCLKILRLLYHYFFVLEILTCAKVYRIIQPRRRVAIYNLINHIQHATKQTSPETHEQLTLH